MSEQSTKYNAVLVIAGVLFIIWGILGLMDAKNYTYAGYNTGDDYNVIKVEEGSPAASAGLQLGDVIKSTGGIAVTDSKALNKRERAKIGETRDIVVDRNGEELTLPLTYTTMKDTDSTNNTVGFIIGLLFILIGVYAQFKHKTALSLSFALFAVCFGYLFMNGPYISSVILSSIVGIISTGFVLFSFTALAIYMLQYPPESAFLRSSNKRLLYIPMLILLAIITIITILQPDGSGTFNMVMRLLFGAFIIFYFGLAFITLIRKYISASSEERSSKGLNMMLIGTVVGLLPILVYFTINTIKPDVELPGNDYVFYTFAAIPIFFFLAIEKQHKAS
ncbi:PDZ domain-containing protein [Lutibacter sp.]|uniref:PDZ domain-containing protein n=1 Tax=Lutibacter sp. TaxID=1925666 RepID=UPI00273444C6|nr:PDZ domain-containing protein [Lutibacter sp.]MDP3313954.1 PDZ domain-containing protein [Lutibacter sp.]